MMTAKRADKADAANKMYAAEFSIVAPACVVALKAVLDYQRKLIDGINAAIAADIASGAARPGAWAALRRCWVPSLARS